MCQFLKISKDPHSPLWKFKYSLTHFFKFSGCTEPPTPPGNYNSLCGGGGVWIFSGLVQFQLNKTLHFSVKIYNILIYQFFYSTV